MSLDPSRWFTEALTIKRQTAHTARGDQTRATTITTTARIQRTNGEAANLDGSSVSAPALVMTRTPLQVGDLLFFPENNTSDQNTGQKIVSVTRHVDLFGVFTHYSASV